jgi:3-hydroxyacyl-[acyl-carrier-protein] dehydratase
MSESSWRNTLRMSTDHPCLPGHFPGRPLVPGVWLLEQVALALQAWRGQRLARVVEAKFLVPLRPGETAELELAERASRLRFEINRAGTLLARGVIEGGP